ncbi:MAG: DUF2252 family protein [Planctomycetes bacterium]|nr:DUF2252 family protein [Planctomycetota bacterium]
MGKLKKASKNSEPQPVAEKSARFGFHPSRAELYAMGKSLRDKCPRASHAAWQPAADRPDPIVLLEASNKGRIQQLIPVRYGRMLVSPFTWYRGAALNMAASLVFARLAVLADPKESGTLVADPTLRSWVRFALNRARARGGDDVRPRSPIMRTPAARTDRGNAPRSGLSTLACRLHWRSCRARGAVRGLGASSGRRRLCSRSPRSRSDAAAPLVSASATGSSGPAGLPRWATVPGFSAGLTCRWCSAGCSAPRARSARGVCRLRRCARGSRRRRR